MTLCKPQETISLTAYGNSFYFLGVDAVALTEEQFSYQHAKLFAIFNHLIHDPWHPNSVYFVDKNWTVQHAVAKVSAC